MTKVFEDGVLEGLASVVRESGVEVGGRGGVVVGGEFFLASEDKGADVTGVEAGDDGFGAVVVLGGEDVCGLEQFVVGGYLSE